ncbi:MAG: class I SAM-dependent RNA methyltransferase [Bacteroidales bacterium]|nr:class I SAM-dependent RNA methyltransferase [Bacteroidales bacterium]
MKLIVKTLCGAEELLSKELEQLGATNITAQRRAVNCEIEDKRMLYRINLWSRFALRTLVPVVEFTAETDKDIYDAIYAYDWQKIISPEKSILIDHISFSSKFNDSQYLAFKAKDAIVDKIRDKMGARPYVNTEDPDIMLNIHATDDGITLSLDASGSSLNRRGYRNTTTPAMTNEVLAAALVELSGWTPDMALIDPMCGSGTICIEAAMKAQNIAPNLYRKEVFGFVNWSDFDDIIWKELKQEAMDVKNKTRLTIIGADIDPDMLDVAKLSTLELGLNTDVRIMRKGFREMERTTEEGVIITVPPFTQEEGKRPLDDLYKELTYFLSRKFPDHDAWIYSTNLKALRAIEYRSEQKYEIFNGSQEGNFNLYPF